MELQLLMQVPHFFASDSSVGASCSADPTFDKYKNGHPPAFSAFRVYSTDVSSMGESEKNQSEEHRVRGSYRKYTLAEKEEAVHKILNGHDVKDVSREYGIPRRNLLRWRKNGCERKEGGGRPTDTEMECILYDKIKNGQIKGEKQIRQMAIHVSRSETFKASKGWYSKFCRRYKSQTGEQI